MKIRLLTPQQVAALPTGTIVFDVNGNSHQIGLDDNAMSPDLEVEGFSVYGLSEHNPLVQHMTPQGVCYTTHGS